MRRIAYMEKREPKRKLRDRKVSLPASAIRAAAESSGHLATQFAALKTLLDADHFDGAIEIDGGRQLGECLATLHVLCGNLLGGYYASLATRKSIPDSVPEPEPNTRKNAKESRGLSQTPGTVPMRKKP